MSYARNVSTAYSPFVKFSINPDQEGLTESEFTALQKYDDDADKKGFVNQFPYKSEFRSMLGEKFPDLSEEGRNYILTAYVIHTQGFEFMSGNPTIADMSFGQKVESVFEQSGMNQFVSSQAEGIS